MAVGGWVLLGIVAACVVALIIVVAQQKKIDKKMESLAVPPKPEPPKPGPSKPEPSKPEPPAPEGPKQNTICAYRSAEKRRLCPVCDGENSMTAARCHICGEALK